MTIRPATREDFEKARAWLVAAGLPTADLGDTHREHFLVAVTGDAPVGVVGLEPFADTGLLRSLVVDPSARSSGIGRTLVTALETYAATQGVKELWLLTIDAASYFETLDYKVVDRNTAPDSVRNTAEFSKLCPGDATLMMKRLG